MRNKKVESAIKGLKSLSPSETDILIVLEYIEKLEKQDEKDFTLIYIKGCVDKNGYWRDKIRDKIKELNEELIAEERRSNFDDCRIIRGQIKLLESLLEGE